VSVDIQQMTRHELIKFIELIQLENGRINTVHAHERKQLQLEIAKLTSETEKLRHPPLKGTSVQKLKAALKRAVTSHGHDYHCSAVRGMERDCHCGWLEIKQLAGVK
jgi:hypothetical protein